MDVDCKEHYAASQAGLSKQMLSCLGHLQDTDTKAQDTAKKGPQRATKQELSWLMRTTYISNEEMAKKQQQQAQDEAQSHDLLSEELQAIEVRLQLSLKLFYGIGVLSEALLWHWRLICS